MKQKKLLIVLVLYKTQLDESTSYLSLKKNADKLSVEYDLLIYNNYLKITIENSEDYTVVNAGTNGMLAGAYNFALNKASNENIEWLLLLDQDTEITSAYIEELSSFLNNPKSGEISAAVPVLKFNDIILSPKRIDNKHWKHHNLEKKKSYQGEKTFAFNSLTLIKTDFLREIGGFSVDFPLDYLDYWYYYKLYEANKAIYVFDVELSHELSLFDYQKTISLERHKNLLSAEKRFICNYLGKSYQPSYRFSLLKRFIYQLIFYKNKAYAKITWSTLTT